MKRVVTIAALVASIAGVTLAHAQEPYPSRPVSIVVPFPPGGVTDLTARPLAAVLERLPRLRICFAHGGGAFPFTLGRLDHGWHVRPEGPAAIPKAPREYARRIWVDSLSHGAGNLAFIVEQLGADRAVIGSDYPFDMGFDDPAAALASIADDNARAFLDE